MESNNRLRAEYKEGSIVWLDRDRSNRSQVTVVRQTPGKLFTTVRGKESEWDVMTNRLSPIEESDLKEL